ncbi:protein NRT1/ PTR FAMILY 5.3-like isoform X2 [Rutidosis leptorrhynchoides]|uniref:protein NRT1/ PTR FAMILY 5.3-like isoform X2 n=1 Tax=Rutidosis leptorrhynchoides TaxID=125765 RepID=UPI003A99E950
MSYYGIAVNLVSYLTRELHQGTVKSSNNVTNWAGTSWLTPLLGAYVADTYLGRYWTFMISSVIYFAGMCLLTLVVSLPSLRPPSCGKDVSYLDCDKRASSFQLGIFYCALYMIAIGIGGTKPNISTFGADQFDDYEPKERAHKLTLFNWWMFALFFGTLFTNTFLVYIQDNVGWGLGYGVPTLGLLVAIIMFAIGTPTYRHKPKGESPFTKMAKVLVASVRNWNVEVPVDSKELYELTLVDNPSPEKFRIHRSSSLRFLDKAAVKIKEPASQWRLCTVTQVEQTKQMVKMIPVLCATFITSTFFPQTQTLFIKQGTTLDRSMGPHFEIPPASLVIRKYTKNPRGITMLQRIGIGIVLHIITIVIASFVERRRLGVARDHDIVRKGQIVPLSIFTLLPQFALMGIASCFVEVAKLEFFYDQAPEGMKSLGAAYAAISLGVGYFLSSSILSTIANVTKKNGHGGWIQNDLNVSHLDYYYVFLAVLSFVNLVFFLIVAQNFDYNAEVNESEPTFEKEDNSKFTQKNRILQDHD